jgi:hypothetical protein
MFLKRCCVRDSVAVAVAWRRQCEVGKLDACLKPVVYVNFVCFKLHNHVLPTRPQRYVIGRVVRPDDLRLDRFGGHGGVDDKGGLCEVCLRQAGLTLLLEKRYLV